VLPETLSAPRTERSGVSGCFGWAATPLRSVRGSDSYRCGIFPLDFKSAEW